MSSIYQAMGLNFNRYHVLHWLSEHQMCLLFIACFALSLFSPVSLALEESDKLAELDGVITTGTKMTKTIAYLIGLGAGAVGTYQFVKTQSLATAGSAAAVSICAFKFPGWVTGTVLI